MQLSQYYGFHQLNGNPSIVAQPGSKHVVKYPLHHGFWCLILGGKENHGLFDVFGANHSSWHHTESVLKCTECRWVKQLMIPGVSHQMGLWLNYMNRLSHQPATQGFPSFIIGHTD